MLYLLIVSLKIIYNYINFIRSLTEAMLDINSKEIYN